MKMGRKILWAGLVGGAVLMGGCYSDNEGHSKTTHKTTVNTPEGKTTTTETREKKTEVYPK
jgi:hypothetical protein